MSPLARWTLAGLCAALALPAAAQDRRAQYRVLQLSDGRELIAEVLATEATGLRLRTPQGEMLLSFELLKDMSPADADQYKLQEAWFVYVAVPEAHRERLVDAYRWVPNTRVQIAGDVVPGLGAAGAAAANRCKQDFPCLLSETEEAPWMWVVSAEVAKDGSIKANAGLNTGPTRTRVEKSDTAPTALWELVHETLQLELPEGGPPEEVLASGGGGSETDPTPEVGPSPATGNLAALSFAPLPGLPAAKQKNGAGVAAAVAITAAGTAAWVGAVGHTAQSAPELAGLSVVGFYATTVFANQVTQKR